MKNGGGGVYIRFPDGSRLTRSIPTGRISTNFRAEACALLEAVRLLNTTEPLAPNTVILTDCRSLLESVQGSRDQSGILRDIRRELTILSSRTNLALQWLPSHCGVHGNEEADRLSKEGSMQDQADHPVSYREAKTLIKGCFHSSWKTRLNVSTETDAITCLNRKQQVIIFRLRTGHCRLLSHLYKLKISHTDECPCGTGTQTPEHILQMCPTYDHLRSQFWPERVDLREKLWGPAGCLRQTADFITATTLDV